MPAWFALDESRLLAVFAGIWCNWTSVLKVKEGEINADLYGFLTTTPNDVVAPIHPKAMLVILTEAEEMDVWMRALWAKASALQRPLLSVSSKLPFVAESMPDRKDRSTKPLVHLDIENNGGGEPPGELAIMLPNGAKT